MAMKDITDTEVCKAVFRRTHDKRRAEDILAEMTGQPLKVCWRVLERAWDRNLIECGISVGTAWLTKDGFMLIGDMPAMDKKEFEFDYATSSGLTIDRLYELGGRAEVCECREDDCVGWQIVFPEDNERLSAALVALTEDIRQQVCELEQLEQSTLGAASRRLHEVWLELVLKCAYALRIDHICSWLARVIRRLTPGG